MRPSIHSPLAAMMRAAQAACAEAERTGAPLDEITDQRAQSPARRQVLTAGLAGAASLALVPRKGWAGNPPRVVIVGGGMAGLACAESLWRQKGITARLFEWNDRLGGRMETLRGYFANGQVAEQHGEFISSEHTSMLGLAHVLGLTRENANDTPAGKKESYWFDGARYTQAELDQDWWAFGYQLFKRAGELAARASYRGSSGHAVTWDKMSVPEWLDAYVPGGSSGRFGKLCIASTISEYGGPPEHQSALNLVYLLGYDTSRPDGDQSPLKPNLAGTDEKWRISGGMDQLIAGLAARLPPGVVKYGCRLTALRENPDRSFTCTFARHGATIEAVADHVVIAIPFTTLRQVDLSGCTLSPLKRTAIASLQLGNNVKIQIQVAHAPWLKDGYDGDLLTDAAPEGGWDTTFHAPSDRPGATSIFDALPGGSEGLSIAGKYGLIMGKPEGPAPAALVADTLAALEPIFPGMTAAWNAGPRRAWVNDGNIDQRLLGAYAQYNIGQYTSFGGIEGVREGNIHFAGEHTSPVFQGFMEGALRSGRRAASEI